MPREARIPLTREEFFVSFLGISKIDVDTQMLSKSGIGYKDFEFLKLIGVGTTSNVYLARKLKTNELFAIKVLAYSAF